MMLLMAAGSGAAQNGAGAQVHTEIYSRDGIVVLTSDAPQEKIGSLYTARENVRIAHKDIVITGGEIEYDDETFEGRISGGAHFSQGDQWFSASRAEFNFAEQTGAFYDVNGYTDKEFRVSGRILLKTGPDTYLIEDGFATTCHDRIPKWSFSAARAEIRPDRTVRMRNAVFRIKGVPVLYTPYMILPTGRKERSSGFVPFNTGTSTTKGQMFSGGYYQTLGRSADILIHGDYFTLRGFAAGGIFRARPNANSRIEMSLYGINDKLRHGGFRITAEGETLLPDNWRAVVNANIYSNFAFRQTFAENLENATVPTEKALGFLTRNRNSISVNAAFSRDMVLYPETPLITKKTPSLEIMSLGMPLGNSPFVFDFRAAFEGLSRSDSLIDTGGVTYRLDIFPRITAHIPPFAGFSIAPSVGLRETYYGARIAPDAPSGVSREGVHRRYFDLAVDIKTPVLERNFHSSWTGGFRHSLEPGITYRRIAGIRDLNEMLAASYNLSTGQWLNSQTSLSYAWDCCSLRAAVNQYDLGLRTESRVSFSFTLKGIGNFGNVRGRRFVF